MPAPVMTDKPQIVVKTEETEEAKETLKRVLSSSSVTPSSEGDFHVTANPGAREPPFPSLPPSSQTAQAAELEPLSEGPSTSRQIKRDRAKVNYKCYSPHDMRTAYKLYIESKQMGNTISIRRLAKVTGIPYATLRDHINGRKNKSSGLAQEITMVQAPQLPPHLPLPQVAMRVQEHQLVDPNALKVLPGAGGMGASSEPTLQTLLSAMQRGTNPVFYGPSLQLRSQPTAMQQVHQSRVLSEPAVKIEAQVAQERSVLPRASHGVQEVLLFCLQEKDAHEYNRAMVTHDIEYLKQLQLVKNVSKAKLEAKKADGNMADTISDKHLRDLMSNGVDYFSTFFALRKKLNGAVLPSTLCLDKATTFVQTKLLDQAAETVNVNSSGWMHGARFSQLVLKAIHAIHTGGLFKKLLPAETVQACCQLCPVWVNLEQNLSANLKKIQEKIILHRQSGFHEIKGQGFDFVALMREYIDALTKADEIRGLIAAQIEQMLKHDMLVLVFRIELFDKYTEVAKISGQDPCKVVLAQSKNCLIEILSIAYSMDSSSITP